MSPTPICKGHGGHRKGSGRPAGSGRYGEPTKPIRVPQSLVPSVQALLHQASLDCTLPDNPEIFRPQSSEKNLELPLFASRIPAGFPSPADDYVEDMLDLEKLLIRHPAATFYLRVSGDSMSDAAIMSGDILVVDRSVDPAHGRIVVASIDNELTVKRLHKRKNRIALLPENSAYQPIEITQETEVVIWGVVTGIVRQV
ncbi:LexA family protein [Acidihalobacter prosperus]